MQVCRTLTAVSTAHQNAQHVILLVVLCRQTSAAVQQTPEPGSQGTGSTTLKAGATSCRRLQSAVHMQSGLALTRQAAGMTRPGRGRDPGRRLRSAALLTRILHTSNFAASGGLAKPE